MGKRNNRLTILQPIVPHYRDMFFEGLLQEFDIVDIYCYETIDKNSAFKNSVAIDTKQIKSFYVGPFLFYNPFTLLKSKSKTLVLMLNFGHITTWMLLLTKWIHRKRIILWGQGISVKRYLSEEKKRDFKLKWMIAFSDGDWIYTEKEAALWKQCFPKKQIVSLNNTLKCSYETKLSASAIKELKKKYGIVQNKILIFSARFENPYRRVDLLLDAIKQLPQDQIGFIIIGGGSLKPDFSVYKNVYDFGKLYDDGIKKELFSIADIYFQPGWVGLSIVEAMSYSLPIFTFKRTDNIKQCVEYAYIIDRYNGLLFDNLENFLQSVQTISNEEIKHMGENALQYAKNNLTIKNMVNRAISIV
ncbi:MAG: glycosyltransferase [Arachidicoccus sp.]|nr:glycosyltransferase [Arachidicoccus sp.]